MRRANEDFRNKYPIFIRRRHLHQSKHRECRIHPGLAEVQGGAGRLEGSGKGEKGVRVGEKS